MIVLFERNGKEDLGLVLRELEKSYYIFTAEKDSPFPKGFSNYGVIAKLDCRQQYHKTSSIFKLLYL